MLGSKVRLNQKVEYHLIFKIQTPHLLPQLIAWVLPLNTHIYCLEQHKQALVLDEICPFVQSLFLFEAPAHTSGRGTDTNGQIIGDEFRKALQWQATGSREAGTLVIITTQTVRGAPSPSTQPACQL